MKEIKKELISCNYEKRENRKIDYIVVHYTTSRTSKKGSAEGTRSWFNNPEAKSSAHYIVDDEEIIQCVEDNSKAWHCGRSDGKYVHPYCRNENSIGIEMASNHPDKTSKSIPSEDAGWYLTEETKKNTAELIAFLCKKYNINKTNIIRHYDVTGKDCPSPLVDDNKEGWSGWVSFIGQIFESVNQTGEGFYIEKISDCPDWAKEAISWFVEKGYLKELNLTFEMTRLLVVMYRMKGEMKL